MSGVFAGKCGCESAATGMFPGYPADRIEDLRWFREAIQRRGQYAGVVFDIGGMALASYAVFGAFDRILIPTLRDTVSQKKQKVFEQMLRQEYEKTENLQYVQLEGQDVDQIADMYVR